MRISDWSSDVCSSDLSSIASRISCSSSPVTVASTSTAAVFCIKPQDQRAITTAPTKPMAASIQTHPRYRPASNAAIARTEVRSEEHTSELQSLMRISYAVFCLKKKKKQRPHKAQVNYQH